MTKKKLLLIGAGALVVIFCLGLGLAFELRSRPHTGLDTATTNITVSTAKHPKPVFTVKHHQHVHQKPELCWNAFGGGPSRDLARPNIHLGLPTKQVWAAHMHDLMEFPPSFCNGTLYVNLERGKTVAVNATNGHIIWSHQAGAATASTPAIAGPRVISTSFDGTITALDRANGRVLWKLEPGSSLESSPVAVGDTVYVGTRNGQLLAIAVATGHVRWAYDTGGRIDASPSVIGSRVCITNYSGLITCLRRSDGAKIWGVYSKRDFVRYESFYASPSADGSRLYTAARSGKVLALSVATGQTVWTAYTGALTYGTPAVASGRIFVGDLGGTLHAFRSTTGATLWSRSFDGGILAPPIVVGKLVFISTLHEHTYAVLASTGAVVWSLPLGKYSPGIATNRFYYLSLNGLLVAFRGQHSPKAKP